MAWNPFAPQPGLGPVNLPLFGGGGNWGLQPGAPQPPSPQFGPSAPAVPPVAPPPAAPAPAPAPAPAGGQPGAPQPPSPNSGPSGPVSQGQLPNAVNDPDTPDVLNGLFDFNSPQAYNALVAPLLAMLSPGLQSAGKDFDPGYRGNWLDEASGGFTGGSFGLPGREADSVATLIMNLLGNEGALQSMRHDEALGILREAALRSEGSPSIDAARRAAALAGNRTDPGSLDALRGSMQNDLSSTLAAQENASMNRLRESGLLGQGATATAPILALQNQMAGNRMQGQFDIERMMEGLTNERIGQAGQAAGASADVERAMLRDPSNALAQVLLGPRNPVVGSINDFLQGVLNLNVGQALSNRGGTFFEDISPLLESAIGAVGDYAGAK